jgi:hypothetical protein
MKGRSSKGGGTYVRRRHPRSHPFLLQGHDGKKVPSNNSELRTLYTYYTYIHTCLLTLFLYSDTGVEM